MDSLYLVTTRSVQDCFVSRGKRGPVSRRTPRPVILASLVLAFVGSFFLAGCPRRPGALRPLKVELEAPEGPEGLMALVEAAGTRRGGERVAFLAAAFLGRPYSAATKARIKKQRKGRGIADGTNRRPLRQEELPLRFGHMDCMTYVENVLALAHADGMRPASLAERALDIRFDAAGLPVYQHQRSHFMSVWARANEGKGYLRDRSGSFSETARRTVHLNLRKGVRTYYVKDAFMRYDAPVTLCHVTRRGLLDEERRLASGDILLWVRDIEGLDVSHVGFYVRKGGRGFLRHASYSANRIQDEPFRPYVESNEKLLGAMVLRPRPEGPRSCSHRCLGSRLERGKAIYLLGEGRASI